MILISRESGGTVIVVVILVACLLVGLAAGFAARALTGERKPSGRTSAPDAGVCARGAVRVDGSSPTVSPPGVGLRAVPAGLRATTGRA